MEKNRWLDFLSNNLQAQIHLEWSRKLQTWAIFILGFISYGLAVGAMGDTGSRTFMFASKVLFLFFFHALMFFGFYFPTLTQKGEGAVTRFLGIRDFSSLTAIFVLKLIQFLIVAIISWQVLDGLKMARLSDFFLFTAWFNFGVSIFYLLASVFFALSYFSFPSFLVKFTEKSQKFFYVMASFHVVAALLLIFGYLEGVQIGTALFFEQVALVSLFWFFLTAMLLGIGKLLRGSAVPALSALQLEVASGKLQRNEDILRRFQEAFILRRLAFWIKRISHRAATHSHEIAQYTHDAVATIEKDKPSELDLRQVEERYKKADSLYRKLEKENKRFLLAMSLFDLSEAEHEKVEAVRDVFSKELRNAKLELASVRNRIDEKLVAIKNIEFPQITADIQPEKVVSAE